MPKQELDLPENPGLLDMAELSSVTGAASLVSNSLKQHIDCSLSLKDLLKDQQQ